MTVKVLAADRWNTNADLIADVAKLGYLQRDWKTLDPTYGRGLWWSKFRPRKLVTHDIAIDGVDFRRLPHRAGSFDAVAFDPPYVSQGGRDTTTIGEFYSRYGLTEAPRTPAGVQELINDGMAEAYRVLAWNGFLIVKTKDYISSGKFFASTHYTVAAALELGFLYVDRFEHVGAPGPQPTVNLDGSVRRQVHARRNLSTLLVFRAPANL